MFLLLVTMGANWHSAYRLWFIIRTFVPLLWNRVEDILGRSPDPSYCAKNTVCLDQIATLDTYARHTSQRSPPPPPHMVEIIRRKCKKDYNGAKSVYNIFYHFIKQFTFSSLLWNANKPTLIGICALQARTITQFCFSVNKNATCLPLLAHAPLLRDQQDTVHGWRQGYQTARVKNIVVESNE